MAALKGMPLYIYNMVQTASTTNQRSHCSAYLWASAHSATMLRAVVKASVSGTVELVWVERNQLMAAQRAGVTRVFIPKDNEEDLRDVAEEVKAQLTILPVRRVEEVLKALEIMD